MEIDENNKLKISDKMRKAIKAKNDKFKKLTKAEKRVAIAKDVIYQLKTEKLAAVAGSYFDANLPPEISHMEGEGDDYDQLQMQDVLVGDEVSCDVCALGALFTCTVQVRNKITFGDFHEGDHQTAMHNYLKDLFSVEQLCLIESAFEMAETSTIYSDDYPKNVEDAVFFGSKYDNGNDRLVAIMRNIIKNEGTFAPPKLSDKIRNAVADGYRHGDSLRDYTENIW